MVGLAELVAQARGNAPLLSVLVMRSWAGLKVRESDGKNRGPVVDAIHELAGGDDADAAAWCARAVVAAWTVAGWATQQDIDPRISRSGSVFHLMHQTARKAPGQVILAADVTDPVGQIRPGDAMIRYEVIDPTKPLTRDNTESGHTEIVQRVYPDGRLDTVGGNTGSQFERDGDGVYIHKGLYRVGEKRVVGFVRPLFVAIDAERGT